MFSPVPVPSVPVVPKSPVPPVLPPKVVPVPNTIGLAPNRLPGVLVVVFNALVPRPPVLEPKLKPVWCIFCALDKLSIVSEPRPAKRTERHHCGYVVTCSPILMLDILPCM